MINEKGHIFVLTFSRKMFALILWIRDALNGSYFFQNNVLSLQTSWNTLFTSLQESDSLRKMITSKNALDEDFQSIKLPFFLVRDKKKEAYK